MDKLLLNPDSYKKQRTNVRSYDVYNCGICNALFTKELDLARHIGEVHSKK